jgi:hypothetical protein
MNKTEQMLIEAISNLFKNKETNLGMVGHEEHTHIMQFQRETIEDMFSLKFVESNFHEDISGAFRDIHSYKYLDDPTFPIALDKRLAARGIPIEERKKALKVVEDIKEELGGADFQEKATGWHPNMDQIVDVTRNANNRKPIKEPPYTGGGPVPAKTEPPPPNMNGDKPAVKP